MERTEEQQQETARLPPKPRGPVKIDNRTLLNALAYRCEHGRKWWSLPQRCGNPQVL
ncbi:MAG: hypothetical protein LBB61_08730 [Treponema sp.]|nr:hypothetical protein [Treponema sp.]